MAQFMDWLFGSQPEMQRTQLMTDEQRRLTENLMQSLGGEGTQEQQQAREQITGMMSQDPMQYYEEAVGEPMRREFQEQTLPKVRESYAGPGTYWGGERTQGEQQARSDLQQNLAEQGAQYAQQGRQMQSQLAEQLAQMGQNRAQQALQAAQAPVTGVYQQPGQEGALGDLLRLGGTIAGLGTGGGGTLLTSLLGL